VIRLPDERGEMKTFRPQVWEPHARIKGNVFAQPSRLEALPVQPFLDKGESRVDSPDRGDPAAGTGHAVGTGQSAGIAGAAVTSCFSAMSASYSPCQRRLA
jgi:hypothetical protein